MGDPVEKTDLYEGHALEADVHARSETATPKLRALFLGGVRMLFTRGVFSFERPTGKVDEEGQPIFETITVEGWRRATAADAPKKKPWLGQRPQSEAEKAQADSQRHWLHVAVFDPAQQVWAVLED